MPPTGQPAAVTIDPGILYVAPIGTTEPTSATSTLDAAFREVGYTDQGSQFVFTVTSEGVEVAEELDPIKYANTKREGSVNFAMAEASRQNLFLALNSGAAGVNNGTLLEPPDPSAQVRVMIVWQSDDSEAQRRWLFRQCFNTSGLDISKQKAPNKSLLPVTFALEKPSGETPFAVWPNASGVI